MSKLTMLIFGVSLIASAAVAAPNVQGFVVKTYASVSDPVCMTFAPNGDLYVGRDLSGSGGLPANSMM